jgi:hypothetical protein
MQTGGMRDPAMSTTHSKTSTETLDLVLDSPDMKPLNSSKLSHTSQWDSARLEAEVRLSHDSQLKMQVVLLYTYIHPEHHCSCFLPRLCLLGF